MIAAGAIPRARTNLPDFAFRWHTESGRAGHTRNPWDASRTPSGSSGGEAAALATGMTPLGLGNDFGGSLRVPSQMCGTAALRPSRGRVAEGNATEPTVHPISIQLTMSAGPMARRIADLRLALGILSAPDVRDPRWVPAPLDGPAIDGPVRVLGLPACAVPVGSDEGLPQGVQLIGGRFREDLILAAAQTIEDRAPVLTPISPRVTVAA